MRVLFILPHPIEGPSGRFRVYNFLPYLRAHGVQVEVRPFMDSAHMAALVDGRVASLRTMTAFARWSLRRIGDVLQARHWDLVFLHRDAFPFGPPLLEALLKRRSGRLIFDFDDFLFERSQIFRTFWERLKCVDKAARVIRMADHTIAGNEFLRQHALRYSPNVTVLPTVIDTDQYRPPARRDPSQPVTIGWMGTPSSAAYLEWLLPVFQRISELYGTRFHCVGSGPLAAAQFPIHITPWSLAGESADLAGFDIGVMPLFDDDEARGKCGLKLLQYMAHGAVPVGSPVGVNAQIIQHESNGMLASTREQWTEVLGRLVQDANLRARLGAAARRSVEEHYSVKAVAPKLMELLTRTCENSRVDA